MKSIKNIAVLLVVLLISFISNSCVSNSNYTKSYYYDGSFVVLSDKIIVSKAKRDELGLNWWIDGCIGIIKTNSKYKFYGANGQSTAVTSGDLENIASECINKELKILEPKSLYNYASGGPIFKISNDEYAMFYHYEYHKENDFKKFYSGYGVAYSNNSGSTFYDCGQIISAQVSYESSFGVIEMTGAPFVTKDGNIMIYFKDYAPNGFINNISVAQCDINIFIENVRKKEAPIFKKYYREKFEESGLGGKSSYLENNNPNVRWMDISYNIDMKKFLMVISASDLNNGSTQLYITLSDDGIKWNKRKKILQLDGESFYPSILSELDDSRSSKKKIKIIYTHSLKGEFSRWDDAVVKQVEIEFMQKVEV